MTPIDITCIHTLWYLPIDKLTNINICSRHNFNTCNLAYPVRLFNTKDMINWYTVTNNNTSLKH